MPDITLVVEGRDIPALAATVQRDITTLDELLADVDRSTCGRRAVALFEERDSLQRIQVRIQAQERTAGDAHSPR